MVFPCTSLRAAWQTQRREVAPFRFVCGGRRVEVPFRVELEWHVEGGGVYSVSPFVEDGQCRVARSGPAERVVSEESFSMVLGER